MFLSELLVYLVIIVAIGLFIPVDRFFKKAEDKKRIKVYRSFGALGTVCLAILLAAGVGEELNHLQAKSMLNTYMVRKYGAHPGSIIIAEERCIQLDSNRATCTTWESQVSYTFAKDGHAMVPLSYNAYSVKNAAEPSSDIGTFAGGGETLLPALSLFNNLL